MVLVYFSGVVGSIRGIMPTNIEKRSKNMALNAKCPKCGSEHVQLSNMSSKHGLIWFLLFGIFWVMWVMVKWCIGATIFICWDWWRAMQQNKEGKGYMPVSRRWFAGSKKLYYCHECHNNFKG